MVLKEILSVLLFVLGVTVFTVMCDGSLPSESSSLCHSNKSCDEECPTWFHPVRSGSGVFNCECGSSLGGIVRCSHETNSTKLLSLYCMTATNISSNTAVTSNSNQIVGLCPYSLHNSALIFGYMTLPSVVSQIDNYTCGLLNRTGLLCAHCKNGLGPAVLSYKLQCLKCLDSPHGWLLYAFLACFPTTLFFLIVVVFQVHATSPSLNVIVFGSQTVISLVKENIDDKMHILERIGYTTIGFWNLDFFRFFIPRFCVSRKLTNIHVLSLEYIVAGYPLLLIASIYIIIELHSRNYRMFTWVSKLFRFCCVPCKKLSVCTHLRSWDPKATIIHAFSTFLLLSYSKFLYISLNLLASVKLYNMNGTEVASPSVLYYDASVHYLSSTHFPFAVFAILILSTVIAFPPLLLLLYPTRLFQKCLGYWPMQWHPLHAFMDTFQGYYKNGTDGTYDYRSFSGIYFILRIILCSTTIINIHYRWLVMIVCPMIVSLLFALLRPYKYKWYNVLDSLFLALTALYGFLILYSGTTDIITLPSVFWYAVSILPLLYYIIFTLYKVLKWLGLLQKCQQMLICIRLRLASGNMQRHHDDFPDRLENPVEYQSLLSLSSTTTPAMVCAEDQQIHTCKSLHQDDDVQFGGQRSYDTYGSFY